MIRSCLNTTLAILAVAMAFWAPDLPAPDAPHDFGCTPCHMPNPQRTGESTTAAGNANVCLSCHNPLGPGAAMPLSHLDSARPWDEGTGSSHAWNVVPENSAAGAQMPESPALLAGIRDDRMTCSTCHNQHSQADGKPFLRMSNADDAMCLDCHRERNVGVWADDPARNIGSHPVGVPIPESHDEYRVPGEGDTHLPLAGGNVLCTTCHSVHSAPSTETLQYHATSAPPDGRSVTVAGAGWQANAFRNWEIVLPDPGANARERRFILSNTSDTLTWVEPLPEPVAGGAQIVLQRLGDGDGMLLHAANDEELCESCHILPAHPPSNPVHSCGSCHDPHGTRNALLVAEEIEGRRVFFPSLSPDHLIHGAPHYDGICEVCHTQTAHHRNNASGDHSHAVGLLCTDCHSHGEAFGASCSGCHEATPATLTTGSHDSHFTAANGPMLSDCATCHGPGADSGTHAGHINGLVNFGGEPTQTLPTTQVCNTCHSPSGAFDGVDDSVVGSRGHWPLGVYEADGTLRAGLELWCATCHDDDPGTPENESSIIAGVSAPGMTGDNAASGFYVTGHGRSGDAYAPESWQGEGEQGNPAAALACTACHEEGVAHIDGSAGSNTRLRPGFSPDQNNSACAQCHDPGGPAVGAPHYYTDSAAYEASDHSFFLCTTCHDVHGVQSSGPAMAVRLEEDLCSQCHSGVMAEFLETSHHDIDDAEQVTAGSRIECTMCHNPHLANDAESRANPDDLSASWSGSDREFCLACHDDDPPAGATFPTESPGLSWDQTGYGDHPHSDPRFSCTDCHGPHGSSNLLLVLEEIQGTAVPFTERGVGGFTQGSPAFNGVCEVCHTATDYHRNNSSGDHTHFTGVACTTCHMHEQEFLPPCGSCHAATPTTLATGSHVTHFLSEIGPELNECDACHGVGATQGAHMGHLNGSVNFAGGASDTLASTGACDTCHSPAGAENGVTAAKSAWAAGVYISPGNLRPGQDMWCIGCHDDDPATAGVNESALIDGIHAPAVAGDNATYGFYVTGHGREGGRFPAMSWQSEDALGNPAASMICSWCHDASAPHLDGASHSSLRLLPGFTPDQSNSGCSQCHRPGGAATSLPTFFTSSQDYEDSVHGVFLCTSCHNPHGSDGPNTAMTLESEEDLCSACHMAVQSDFERASHHDVDDAEQAASGSRVECTMCHNPHLVTRDLPLTEPEDPITAWTGTESQDFCLICHGGAPPAAVAFPASSSGSGFDQSAFVGTLHDEYLGGDCLHCHSPHGSSRIATLVANYSVAEDTQASQGSYQLCFQCHDFGSTVNSSNAFSTFHDKHVVEERTPCISCHNAHAPHDAAESGLIDFSYAVDNGFDISLSVESTPYDLSSSFLDTGVDRGRCYLTCHDQTHEPKTYSGVPVQTVDCLLCHVTPP